MMLDIDSVWWKYVTLDKMLALLQEAKSIYGEDLAQISITPVDNIALLDKDLYLLGVIDISEEVIENHSKK